MILRVTVAYNTLRFTLKPNGLKFYNFIPYSVVSKRTFFSSSAEAVRDIVMSKALLTCTETACLTCSHDEGYHLVSNTCVGCGMGKNVSGAACLSCSASCKTCIGSATNYTSCNPDKILWTSGTCSTPVGGTK